MKFKKLIHAVHSCIICTLALFSIQNHFNCQHFKVNEAACSVYCKTISSAILAVIHRDSHTQSCFLTALHTCRGYELGINITRSTHFHLTLTSLFAFFALALLLSLSLSLFKPSENIGGSLYWLQHLGFSPRRLKCLRLPDVSLKSPVPPLAVAPGYYYLPLKE